MFARATLLSLLLFLTPLFSQHVKMPEKVQVQPGRLASVAVEWDGDDLRWIVPSQLDVFREYDPDPKVVRLRVIGYTPGVYRIVAVTCKDKKLSEFAYCDVTVGDGPGPNPPGPNPPVPPTPPDPLAESLAKAFLLDSTPEREQYKPYLSAVYKNAAELNMANLRTAKDLFDVLRAGATAKIPSDSILKNVRTTIQTELKKILPLAEDAPLTDDHKKQAKELSARVHKALESIK